MKRRNILLIACTIFVFAACENEIPFNIKDHPPKLVLNALIDSDKEVNTIFLSLTGREEVSADFDAVVSIYINGELKEQPTDQHMEGEISYAQAKTYYSKLKFKPGSLVKIEAKTTDGKYHAWAEVVVPDPIEIEKMDTVTGRASGSSDSIEYKYIGIETTFTDDPLVKNYYQFAVYQIKLMCGQFEVEGSDTCRIFDITQELNISQDFVLMEGRLHMDEETGIFGQTNIAYNMYYIFDDSRLKGSYAMGVYTSFSDRYGESRQTEKMENGIQVRLISLSEDLYYYYRALNLYGYGNHDDILSLPISFPSNVHGGTGIVGFRTITSRFIHY